VSRVFGDSKGSVLTLSSQIRYPVLGLFGGADPNIPSTDIQALDANLDKAGVEHEIIVYPDAPHSFFDRRSANFAAASSDAWHRVLAFIKAHTPA
jgi:carboxymethylenebutenolidase